MTRDTLHRLGVPECCRDGLLDAWDRDLARESVRLATACLRETVASLPPPAGGALHAALKALTPKQAAWEAGVTRRTIDRAIAAGEIRSVRGSSGLVLLDHESFNAWVRARAPVSKLV
jgi:excisionase family DNA binding protein